MLLYFCAVKLRHDSRVRNATNRHLFVLRFSISLSASLSLTFGSPNLSEKTTLSLSFERVPTSNHVPALLHKTAVCARSLRSLRAYFVGTLDLVLLMFCCDRAHPQLSAELRRVRVVESPRADSFFVHVSCCRQFARARV